MSKRCGDKPEKKAKKFSCGRCGATADKKEKLCSPKK